MLIPWFSFWQLVQREPRLKITQYFADMLFPNGDVPQGVVQGTDRP